MADDGSHESSVTRSSAPHAPLPPILVPKPFTSVDRTLQAWDGDILRAATTTVARLRDHRVDADDLAQVARIQLWRALAACSNLSDHYIRKLISNAMRSAARQARKGIRLEGDIPAFYAVPASSISSTDSDREEVTGKWIAALSARERTLYDSLYVEGLTQREAAQRLELSQPRIAQLHRQLLHAGHLELANAAA